MNTGKQEIKDVYKQLMSIPNEADRNNVGDVINLLNTLLRIRHVTPPITEIVTLLKHEKPLLFYTVKKSILPSSNLKMLFEMSGDIDLAYKRLDNFFEEESWKTNLTPYETVNNFKSANALRP